MIWKIAKYNYSDDGWFSVHIVSHLQISSFVFHDSCEGVPRAREGKRGRGIRAREGRGGSGIVQKKKNFWGNEHLQQVKRLG